MKIKPISFNTEITCDWGEITSANNEKAELHEFSIKITPKKIRIIDEIEWITSKSENLMKMVYFNNRSTIKGWQKESQQIIIITQCIKEKGRIHHDKGRPLLVQDRPQWSQLGPRARHCYFLRLIYLFYLYLRFSSGFL